MRLRDWAFLGAAYVREAFFKSKIWTHNKIVKIGDKREIL